MSLLWKYHKDGSREPNWFHQILWLLMGSYYDDSKKLKNKN